MVVKERRWKRSTFRHIWSSKLCLLACCKHELFMKIAIQREREEMNDLTY